MELRHLRYFVAVAEEEHITRAAIRLGIQQPPLSQQIRQLEDEIGVDLFDRSPRKIRLNSAGRVFLSDARRVLAMAHDAVQRVRQFELGREGALVIGLTSSASLHPLTIRIFAAFRAAYPLFSLKIEEGANHELLNLVEEERLDLAFVRTGVGRYPHLECRTLAVEGMVAAIPAAHLLAKPANTPILLKDLAEAADLLVYRHISGAGLCESLFEAFAAQGLKPRVINETERMLSAVNMTAAGFGVTVVPKALEAFRVPSLVYRDINPADGFVAPLNIAFRTGSATNSIRRFSDICTEAAAGR